MADGCGKAGAAVERDARPYQDGIECRDGAEGVGTAVGRALGADIVKQEDELLLRRSGGHCAIPTCVCRNCWPSKFLRKEIIFCQHLDRPHTPTNFLSFLLSVDINRHNISFSHENTFGKTLH